MSIERPPAVYLCDISGLAANGLDEIQQSKVDEDDVLGDAPLGWSRITVVTRVPNEELAQYAQMYKQAQAQLQKDLKGKKDELANALWALEAQFADFLDQPDYVTESTEIWVHPAQLHEALKRLNPDIFEDSGTADLDEPEPEEALDAAADESESQLDETVSKKEDSTPAQA